MKNRKLIFILIIILIVVMTIIFTSCSSLNFRPFNTVKYFDTLIVYNAQYDSSISDKKVESTWDEICKEFERLDSLFDVYNENSNISKFNNANPGAVVEIEKDTYDLIQMAYDIYILTKGAFNPAMYWLSDLWGFTERFHNNYIKKMPYDREDYTKELPSKEYIDGFLSIANFKDIELESKNDKYFIKKPNSVFMINDETYSMHIDLSGIAKGYISAKAMNISKNNGIKYGYINIGTSSLVLLNKEKNKNWQVSLNNPRGEGIYLKLKSKAAMISTSGDYEQYYTYNDKRYCHIIDPFTGYPVQTNIISSTVYVEYNLTIDDLESIKKGAYMDALSTAIMIMGKDKALDFMTNTEYNVIFVFEENGYNVYSNSYIEKDNNQEIVSKDYKLVKWQ